MESTLAERYTQTRMSKSADAVGNFVRKSPWHAFWGLVIIVLITMAALAPVIAPYDPIEPNVSRMRLAPDSQNWTGTDIVGRDVTSRLIYGARASLFIAVSSVVMGTLVGGVWGSSAGFSVGDST